MLDDLKKMFSGDALNDLRNQVGDLKDKLKLIQVTGQSGADMVKVTINGNYKCTNVTLSDEVMQENKEVIEGLIQNAIDKANTQLQDVIKQATLDSMQDKFMNK